MSKGINGNLGLLLALAALGGMGGLAGIRRQSESEQELADHGFKPLSGDPDPEGVASHRKTLGDLQQQVMDMNVDNLDTLVVLAVQKPKEGPCENCGKVHPEGTVANELILGVVGNPLVSAQLTNVFLELLQEKFINKGGDGRMSLDELFQEFDRSRFDT
jgi:hypothetical protein